MLTAVRLRTEEHTVQEKHKTKPKNRGSPEVSHGPLDGDHEGVRELLMKVLVGCAVELLQPRGDELRPGMEINPGGASMLQHFEPFVYQIIEYTPPIPNP